MASVTADWPTGITPQWMQTTQPQITTAFLEMTGLGWASTVTTGGANTSFIDLSLNDSYTSDREWIGFWVRFTGGTAQNLGAIRQIQSYDPDTGTLAFDPALTANVTTGDTYEVWGTTVRPKTVLNILDRLTSTFGLALTTYSMISEVPDFDMEQSGTAAWAATNATMTKVSWTGKTGISGKQAMSVLTTSANGYVQTAEPIRIRGGSSLSISALFTPDDPTVTTTGFLSIYDAISGALVQNITTTSKTTTRLWRSAGVGSTDTTLIHVRYGQQENGVEARWDDIVVQDLQSNDQPLPYWMGTESAFKEAYLWRPTSSGPGFEEYDPALTGPVARGWRPVTDQFSNGGRLRLRGPGAMSLPMFVQGVRFDSPWASLTEAKPIDQLWAATCLAMNYYQRLKGQFTGNKEMAGEMLNQYQMWQEEFQKHDRRVRSMARTTQSPIASWRMA